MGKVTAGAAHLLTVNSQGSDRLTTWGLSVQMPILRSRNSYFMYIKIFVCVYVYIGSYIHMCVYMQ